MNSKAKKPSAGEMVVLDVMPPGLLNGLPKSDQAAISAIVGKPVLLVGYDEDGRAELEFVDREGHNHSIWLNPRFLQQAADRHEIRCWVEFHDSVLVAVNPTDRSVVLILDGYVHIWEIVEDARRGTGWMQPVRVSLTGSSVLPDALVVPIDVSTGLLAFGAMTHRNLVPLPTRSSEATYLRLEFMDATVLELRGMGVEVEAAGAARYVEDLPADLWPGD